MQYLVLLFLACADRFRGGGFINTGSTALCRAVWAVCLAAAYGALIESFSLTTCVVIAVCAYLSFAFIDHSMAMNMGRWTNMQCRWYTRFLIYLPFFPTATWKVVTKQSTGIYTAPWGAATPFQKTLFDTLQMVVVGALRGIVVFVPLTVANAFDFTTLHSIFVMPFMAFLGAGVLACLQPVSYLLGWYVPFSIPAFAAAKSSDWGEVFSGAAWGVALLVLV